MALTLSAPLTCLPNGHLSDDIARDADKSASKKAVTSPSTPKILDFDLQLTLNKQVAFKTELFPDPGIPATLILKEYHNCYMMLIRL